MGDYDWSNTDVFFPGVWSPGAHTDSDYFPGVWHQKPGSSVALNHVDHAEDGTSQTTYTFATQKPSGFAIGAANANRKLYFCTVARWGTNPQSVTGATVNGVAATKEGEIADTSSGDSIMTIWSAPVPTGTAATINVMFASAPLRCGVDVWTAVGSTAMPSTTQVQSGTGAGVSVAIPATTVPSNGGAIVFSSAINSAAPTLIPTNSTLALPSTLISSTMYYGSSYTQVEGSTLFTDTWSAGSTVVAGIAVAISP